MKASKKKNSKKVSKIKLSNQRKNKLIKKGKLKPNSNSIWVKNQVEKNRRVKQQQQTEVKVKAKPRVVDDEEEEENEDEMMDLQDAMMLSK